MHLLLQELASDSDAFVPPAAAAGEHQQQRSSSIFRRAWTAAALDIAGATMWKTWLGGRWR